MLESFQLLSQPTRVQPQMADLQEEGCWPLLLRTKGLPGIRWLEGCHSSYLLRTSYKLGSVLRALYVSSQQPYEVGTTWSYITAELGRPQMTQPMSEEAGIQTPSPSVLSPPIFPMLTSASPSAFLSQTFPNTGWDWGQSVASEVLPICSAYSLPV